MKVYTEMNAAILVVSFDGYSDVWPAFFECKTKYWPDCPLPTYLVSNEKSVPGYDCITIKTGVETNWCDRVKRAVVDFPYSTIILLLEDYLVGSKVDNSLISDYLDFFVDKKCRYLRIIDIPRAPKGAENTDHLDVIPIRSDVEYGINLQPSIWNKQFLLELLDEVEGNRSAWDFEVMLLQKAVMNQAPVYGCFAARSNVLSIHNGVQKGKWFPNEINYFKSRGIIIPVGSRKVLSIGEVMEYRIRLYLRELMTPSFRKKLKRVLRKFGFSFASNE